MAVAFKDDAGVLAVGPGGTGARLQVTGIIAQPHGAAFAGHRALFGKQVYNGIRRFRIELGGIRLVRFEHEPGEFDHHYLHAQAQAEIRNLVLAGIARRLNHAFDAADAEPAWYDHALDAAQLRLDVIVLFQFFRMNPRKFYLAVVIQTGVAQRLSHRIIGVFQLHVFAHHGDIDRLAGIVATADHALPGGQIGSGGLEAEALHHQIAHAFAFEHQRDFINAGYGRQRNDGLAFNVAEERDLVPDAVGYGVIGAADDDIWLDTHAPELVDAVLSGLGL